ncbi:MULTISPECIES: hypothetical protein [unclassified Sphingobacterium]|uniref:hypothetical protein n=1 Tax=unclassified Sphingobacterium TaxID=2609468 RepID=UPI0025E96564|nr:MULTISPECIES: hypothetical protein [unclassified Sphingobacterium]
MASLLESREERKKLNQAAKQASEIADKENRALDLSVQVVEDGYIVEKHVDGTRQIIKKIDRIKSKVKLKKGIVLCLEPKGKEYLLTQTVRVNQHYTNKIASLILAILLV